MAKEQKAEAQEMKLTIANGMIVSRGVVFRADRIVRAGARAICVRGVPYDNYMAAIDVWLESNSQDAREPERYELWVSTVKYGTEEKAMDVASRELYNLFVGNDARDETVKDGAG